MGAFRRWKVPKAATELSHSKKADLRSHHQEIAAAVKAAVRT
jgi:hypothetical protein